MGNGTIRREPIGVCGLITPWNWPLNQLASKVAPLSAMLFAQIVHEADLPPGVFNLVNGDGPIVGEAIVAHPLIDMVSFTGSTAAGVRVAKPAADTVRPELPVAHAHAHPPRGARSGLRRPPRRSARPGQHHGPLVSRAQFGKVLDLIRSGIREGATLVAGGPGRPAGGQSRILCLADRIRRRGAADEDRPVENLRPGAIHHES
ncbi:aldehyde dehydrogenase family protein [Roseomonas xinghualingensis]|uniref:aldehyde dehydrogenase family protein n=1 Tax=Roseomonas xinghualingensis TaxID=2986475 RepID=UPI0021F0C8BE|nr:aldehyde dehydrogenase family protein [Roseomonas sp. SXEYE001]